jgi:hypothetical protein
VPVLRESFVWNCREGCPVSPGSSLQKVIHLTPNVDMNRNKAGVALDGKLRHHETGLASSTL